MSWTVVGWVKPRSLTAWISSGARPSVTKPLGMSATTGVAASGASMASWGSRLMSLEMISADENSPAAKVASVMKYPKTRRAPQVVRLLRSWLKNINHQTEPALTQQGECVEKLGVFLRQVENNLARDPVNVGRCTKYAVISAKPRIMPHIRVSTELADAIQSDVSSKTCHLPTRKARDDKQKPDERRRNAAPIEHPRPDPQPHGFTAWLQWTRPQETSNCQRNKPVIAHRIG